MSNHPNFSRPRQIPVTQFYQPPPPLDPQAPHRPAPPAPALAPGQALTRQPSRPVRHPSPATTTTGTTSSGRYTAISSHSSEAGWLPAGALPGGPPPLGYSVQRPEPVGVIEEHPAEEGWGADGQATGSAPAYEGHWWDRLSVSAYSAQTERKEAVPPLPVAVHGSPAQSQGAFAAFGLDRKPTLSAPLNGRPPPVMGQADRAGNRLQALQMPPAPPPRAVLAAPPSAAVATADTPGARFGDSPASAAPSQRPTPHRVGSMDWTRFSVMMRKTRAEEYDRKFADKDSSWLATKAKKNRACKRWAVVAGLLALAVLAGLLCWHFLTKDGPTEPRTLGGSKDGGATSAEAGSSGSSGASGAASTTTEGLGIHWNFVEASAGVASAVATAGPVRRGRRAVHEGRVRARHDRPGRVVG